MAQPPGIGLAPTGPAPPQNSPLAAVGGALQGTPSSAPQFNDNPLGAIGLILSNAAAGFRGQELPTQKIARNQLAQQQINLQQLRVNLDAVKAGVDMFIGLDPDDPRTSAAIDRFAAQFSQTLGPGFTESLNAGLELARNQGQEAINGLVEHQERIQGLCGLDQKCIQDAASNAALMNQFNETADQERLPAIVQKLQLIGEIVGDEAVQALKADGFTVSDLQQFPGEFAFTPEEIRTVTRNKQIQDALIPLGFKPPDLDRLQQERLVVEATAAAFRPPAAGPTPLREDRLLDLKRQAEADGDEEAVAIFDAAIEKATTIVGRTEQDIGATPGEAESVAAGEAARAGAANIATFSSLLSEIERAGEGAGGIRGLLGSTGAGLLGQLNTGLAEGFSEAVTGVSPAELTSIRQRARTVIAQSITQLTGEESGRFTEAERRMTEEALRLLEPGASFEQIRGALGTAVSVAFVVRDGKEMLAGIEPRFDLDTNEGRTGLLEELILNLGLNSPEALVTLDQITLQRRLMRESGGGR